MWHANRVDWTKCVFDANEKTNEQYYWIQLTVVGIVIATNKVPLRISRRVVYTTKQFWYVLILVENICMCVMIFNCLLFALRSREINTDSSNWKNFERIKEKENGTEFQSITNT